MDIENIFSFSLQKSFSYLKVIIMFHCSHILPKLITTNNFSISLLSGFQTHSWFSSAFLSVIASFYWDAVLKIEYCISCCLMRWSFRALIWADANLWWFSGAHKAKYRSKDTKLWIFSVRKHFKWLMPLGCLSGEGKDNFTVDLLNDISGMCTAKKFLFCLVLIRDFNLDFF